MALATRSADVVWEGDLMKGKGRLDAGTGAFRNLAVSWKARAEEAGGNTSPEELLAAAHATCYAMALSNTIATAGHTPERLEVHAEFDLDKSDPGVKITRVRLRVRGKVAGVDEAGFKELAKKGEQGCPVSNAIRGNVDISLDAALM